MRRMLTLRWELAAIAVTYLSLWSRSNGFISMESASLACGDWVYLWVSVAFTGFGST